MRVCSCEPGLYGRLTHVILWWPCMALDTHILAKLYVQSATLHLTPKSVAY